MILLILLSCVGLTFILKYGKPTQFIRNFFSRWEWGAYLFKCSLCLGLWAGLLHAPFTEHWILLPCASAALSWTIDSFNQCVQIIEAYIKDLMHRED